MQESPRNDTVICSESREQVYESGEVEKFIEEKGSKCF